MLTAVKNQLHVSNISFKYALMRGMLNKATFFSDVFFMILNNSCMIFQWIVLFNLKHDIGGYNLKEVLLLWGMAAGTYGVAHVFFQRSFSLSETIYSGQLDTYIVQPKNILLQAITADISISAIGDILFAYIMYFIYGFSLPSFILFTIFCITGGLILVSVSIILHSLSFWFTNAETTSDVGNNLMVNFATYPDGIFKGFTKWLLFTLIPVGIANYIPIKVIVNFNPQLLLINLLVTVLLITLAFLVFYEGLKKYSSSSLMNARI